MLYESTRNICMLCSDVITNPICFRCLESEVKQWLSTRKPELIPKLKKAGRMFSSYVHHTGTNCILCGKNMNVCTHCYCYEISTLLEKTPELANEFIDFFNFELRVSTIPP